MGAAVGAGTVDIQGTNQALLVAFPVLRCNDLQTDNGGVHGVAEHFLGSSKEEKRNKKKELFEALQETVEVHYTNCESHIAEIYC